MKKILIITYCLLLSILAGCGSNPNLSESTIENIGEIQVEEPTPNDEILSLTLETPAFQIGDTVLYLNKSTLQDFINAGGEFELGYGFTHLDSMMKHGAESVGVKYKNAKFMVYLVNNTGSEIPVKNSVINSIREVKDKDIIISSGIMIGDTFNSVMEKTNNGLTELPSDSSLQLKYIYKHFKVTFNKESLTIEEISFEPPTIKPNYLSDLNQITENSWNKIKELYFNTDLSKIDTFYTDKTNIKTIPNKYASLTNITPKKILLGVRNKDDANYNAPYNVLFIEAVGDIAFTNSEFSDTSLKTLESYNFSNPCIGAYTYCYIPDLIISEQGDINLTIYDKFAEVSTNAWYEEEDVKEYAVFHLNYAPNLKNYIWYELELDW